MDFSMDVLLVDDLPNMRRLMRGILRNIGFKNIHEAGDGKAALKCLGVHDIGLIVSDWNMPNMTGIEFLKHVRTIKKHKTTPFLMVTAEATKENIMDAVSAGVSNYVVKPVQEKTVEDRLKQIFKSSGK